MKGINKTVYYLGMLSQLEDFKENGLSPSYKIEGYDEEVCLFNSLEELKLAMNSWLGSYLKAKYGKDKEFVIVKVDAPIDNIIQPILAQKVVAELFGRKQTPTIPKIDKKYLSYLDKDFNPIDEESK